MILYLEIRISFTHISKLGLGLGLGLGLAVRVCTGIIYSVLIYYLLCKLIHKFIVFNFQSPGLWTIGWESLT